MQTTAVIQHVPFEHLGTFEPLLRARGHEIHYVDATVDDLADPLLADADLLVVLGGPIGAFDEAAYPLIARELAVVRQRLEAQRPLLGICLGAQLIARALGAAVRAMADKEIGFAPVTLTAAGEASPLAALGDVPVLHWHGDMFDLPEQAARLAATAACANQAFSFGANVLALQCHLEADPAEIERWLVGHACELAAAGIAPGVLREQAQALHASLPRAAEAVFGQWLDNIVETPVAVA